MKQKQTKRGQKTKERWRLQMTALWVGYMFSYSIGMNLYLNEHIFFKEPVSERRKRFCRYLKLVILQCHFKNIEKSRTCVLVAYSFAFYAGYLYLLNQQLSIAVVLLDLIVTRECQVDFLYEYGDAKDYVTPKIQACIFLRHKSFRI